MSGKNESPLIFRYNHRDIEVLAYIRDISETVGFLLKLAELAKRALLRSRENISLAAPQTGEGLCGRR